ncbi:hypothetical protein HJ008_23135 [Vibrio parahaemolyticus]|nr:hypothetical protein [Vibrio parahaemolyticus]
MRLKVVEKIRLVLNQTKEQGHDAISIEAFEAYLSSIEHESEEHSKYAQMQLDRDLAVFMAENDRNIAHAFNQTAGSLEMFKSVIATGQAALKASMVINGGAAVALLAFLGKIWGTNLQTHVAESLSCSIYLFCVGIVVGAFACGTTYFTQCSHNYGKVTLANILTLFTVILVLGSYSIFIYAANIAASAFGLHFGL